MENKDGIFLIVVKLTDNLQDGILLIVVKLTDNLQNK